VIQKHFAVEIARLYSEPSAAVDAEEYQPEA
jgi:hypothetical protein